MKKKAKRKMSKKVEKLNPKSRKTLSKKDKNPWVKTLLEGIKGEGSSTKEKT